MNTVAIVQTVRRRGATDTALGVQVRELPLIVGALCGDVPGSRLHSDHYVRSPSLRTALLTLWDL